MMKWQVVIFLLSYGWIHGVFALGDTEISQKVEPGGAAVVNASTGNVNINMGIPFEKYDELQKRLKSLEITNEKLGVNQKIFEGFVKTVYGRQIKFEELAIAFDKIANDYKEMMQQAATFTSDEPEVKRLLTEAKTALDNGKSDTAEKLYNQASDQDIAMMAKQLQEIARKRLISASQAKSVNGKIKMTELAYQEAADYYQQAVKLLPEGFEKDKGNYLNEAGIAFFYAGEYQQALPLYKEALRIREQILDKPEDYAESLSNLALLYQVQKQYEQAEPLYQKALQIYEQVLVSGKQHPNYATTLNDLGTLYSSQEQYKQAFPLLQQALKICEETLGKQHPDCAANLVNLAQLYQKQGEYEQTEQLYQEALKIYELDKLHHPNPNHAVSLHNFAVFYQQKGKYEKALPLLQQAVEIQTKALGENRPTDNSQLFAENLRYTQELLDGKYQVIATEVHPDKPAAQLGIQVGDIFTHYNQQPILGKSQFTEKFAKEFADTIGEFKLLRDGKTLTFQLKPNEIEVKVEEKLKYEP